MSYRVTEYIVTGLQEMVRQLQAQIQAQKKALDWRDIKIELPPKPGGYIVADMAVPEETNWWADFWDGKTWQVEGDGVWTHWRPIGSLPGEGGSDE